MRKFKRIATTKFADTDRKAELLLSQGYEEVKKPKKKTPKKKETKKKNTKKKK